MAEKVERALARSPVLSDSDATLEGNSQRAFITDLRLSAAQRGKTHYSPDYHTLGRGLTGKKYGSNMDVMPVTHSLALTASWQRGLTGEERLPVLTQKVLKRATNMMKHATNQSRIYDELPPRGSHVQRDLPPIVYSHEKSKPIPYKQVVAIRTNKHYHTM